jgi:hypothetical protein
MPQPLRDFDAGDWQEWLLDGPDPAAEGYGTSLAEFYDLPHPVVVEDFRGTAVPTGTKVVLVGIGDQPELVAHHRLLDAHKRWLEARRGWLCEHVDPQAGFDFWLDAVSEHHRIATRDHPAARGRAAVATPRPASAASPTRGSGA